MDKSLYFALALTTGLFALLFSSLLEKSVPSTMMESVFIEAIPIIFGLVALSFIVMGIYKSFKKNNDEN